jgi:LysM repeat protein
LIAVAVILAGMGMNTAPVKAQTTAPCASYHTVWWGQTLSGIGQMYNVSWQYLAQINNIWNPRYIYAGQVLCIPVGGPPYGYPYGTGGPYYPWYGTGGPYPGAPGYYYPSFTITSVKPGVSLTITGVNFPANDTYDILINYYGTLGIGGVKVGTINSGSGSFTSGDIPIPPQFANQYQLAIRLQSPTTGYYAYNWFYNQPYNYGIGGPYNPIMPGPIYWGVPTFSISGVVANSTVTIVTNNFAANDTYVVKMAPYGNAALGGIPVQNWNSGPGGSQVVTFPIPPQLYGLAQIAIRLESPTSGYYAYNWFWNNTTY